MEEEKMEEEKAAKTYSRTRVATALKDLLVPLQRAEASSGEELLSCLVSKYGQYHLSAALLNE